jgi:hypothetical protein
MIMNASLCEMNRMAIVPANEFFELDALAVFCDLAQAILLHSDQPERASQGAQLTGW